MPRLPASLDPQLDAKRRLARAAIVLAPFAVYFALAVAATWPAAILGASAIPGFRYTDEVSFLWNGWLVSRWLWEGEPLWRSDMAFGPQGFYFFIHTHSFLQSLLAAGLKPLVPLAASYNAILVASFFLAACSARALARAVGLKPSGAFAAGLVFSFSAHRMAHVPGHPNLVAVEAIPLACLLLLRLFQAGPRRWSFGRWTLLAGTALYCAYIDYYIAAYWFLACCATALALAASAPRRALRMARAWRFWTMAILSGTIVVAAATPLWSSWSAAAKTWQQLPDAETYHLLDGVDLATAFVPPSNLALWRAFGGEWATGIPGRSRAIETEGYLGWPALLLAVAAFAIRPSSKRLRAARLAALALFAASLILALGADIIWGEARVDGVGLYGAIKRLPVLNNLRAPGRFVMIAALPLGLLAGVGLDALFRFARSGSAGRRRAVHIAVAILAFLFTLETTRSHSISPLAGKHGPPLALMKRIRESPASGSVVVLPLFDHASIPNLLQVFHERPTYHAFLARNDQYLAGQLTTRDLGLPRFPGKFEPSPDPAVEAIPSAWDVDGHASAERLRATLAAFDLRWVVVAPGPNQDAILRYFGERVPVAWVERDAVDAGWVAFEVGQLGPEDEIVVASEAWQVAPSDWDNRIGLGREPGWIIGRDARFFVHVSERQRERARLPRLTIEGQGLPPRLSDGATQEMRVYWDDESVVSEPIVPPPGGDAWTIPLPLDRFAPGWHWLRLEFARDLRPVDCIEGSDDERPLAFCVKKIALSLDFAWSRPPDAAPAPDAPTRLVGDRYLPCSPDDPGAVGAARAPGFVEGREAEFVFAAPAALPAGAAPRVLLGGFGLPPTLKGGRRQMFNVYWNDRLLTTAPIEASDQRQFFAVDVPAKLVAPGFVRLKLEFLRDIRANECVAGSDDDRLLAYFLQTLEVDWIGEGASAAP